MANIFLILFVACVINSMCSAQRTAVGRLNTEVRKLKGKTDSLQTEVDNIWIEVNDIWTEVSGPGRIAQNFNNRTGTDGLGNSNSQNCETNKTVDIVQDLKVEVEHFVLTVRDGRKTEKHWQRETVKNLTEMFDDFKTGMTEESIVVNDQIERLDNESASTHKYCENIRRDMETSNTETNERMSEMRKELEAQGVINEQMKSKNHALSQTMQEMQNDNENMKTENHALSQTIQEMQTDNENIKTENHALSQTIQEMQNDNENIKTENKALSQTIQEMQNDNENIKTENKALSQTIQEMQNDDENKKTEIKALGDTIQEMQDDNENIKTEIKALGETLQEMQDDKENIKTVNKALSQTIQEMQNDDENIQTEIKALSQTIQDMQNDDENIQTEIKALSQTIQEMQNDNENIKIVNKTLSQTIREMENDDENKKTKNKALSETTVEMQTTLEDTLSSAITTKATLHYVHSCDEGWKLFHGHCYLFVKDGKSWDDASAFCKNRSSYLTEITSDAEFEFIAESMHKWWMYWIGGTSNTEGVFWYPLSKQEVPDNFWKSGQPDKFYGREDCAVIRHDGVVKLYDHLCNDIVWFLCEKLLA